VAELRTDWLTGRSVIIAENRAGRPNEFAPPSGALPQAPPELPPNCPFCAGHEESTPPAVYEQTDAAGRWQVRVIPNKFPAVSIDAGDTASARRATATITPRVEAIVAEFPCAELSLPSAPLPVAESSLPIEVAPAFGAHEVIIESPRHLLRTASLSVRELHDALEAYRARLAHWRDDGRLQYALVFKNQGPRAGASLAHLHSQLVALPAVPSKIASELARAEQAYRKRRACPYCEWVAAERTGGERIVLDRDGFVAFCPAAGLQPYETWLLPAGHEPSFDESLPSRRVDQLSAVLHALVDRLESLLPSADYNVLLRTAPWIAGIEPWSHWRIELLPRVASLAGMELGSGVHINPLSPEHAAARLREI
jgi:UDPglucose--hexose-1-phosphate uridylyltransferase